MNIHPKLVRTLILSAGVALLFCAPALRADTIWDWSYSSNNYTGSGTFTTEEILSTGISGFTGFRILDISGTWDRRPITQLLPRFSYGSNDNLIALSSPQLDSAGLAFTNTDTNYRIFYAGSGILYSAQTPGFTDSGTFSATAQTSEPATALLVVPGLVGFALFVRYRNVNVRPHS